MKSSAVILFVIVYCCTAAPQKDPKCLDGRPREDNTVGFCDFYYQYRYWYNQDSKDCESFLYCFQKGNNQFDSYEDCKKRCME
ncbi:Kunitz/Bovine pancreatic trypsin inhibitor domain protein [Ancylostoma caninum]|uniref:Kunitz/Bovine pancreatic trypsin inhibitor domain protein n=1 Tax=Ancylostoma caninum TaxID=29170 RepID=A0A368GUI7_ANCCA|nr:Kunitz/Bovine pancreatic trypsin inhibitor domain protein [Ancylostoma caninum]